MADDQLFPAEDNFDSHQIWVESAYHTAVDGILAGSTGMTADIQSANSRRYMPPSYNFVPVANDTGMNLDILSASSYPVPVRASQPRRPDPGSFSMYGGLIFESMENSDSQLNSGSQEEEPPKKKQRKGGGTSDDANAKKQRGRPRLDTRDETAADRRRTQIRLAQRAYRLRKETTISALKKRVTALESTIEEMNKTFLKFNDDTISSGLLRSKPELAEQLRCTTEHFLSLSRTAASESDQEDDGMDDMNADTFNDDQQWWTASPKRNGRGLKTNPASNKTSILPLGYEFFHEESGDGSSKGEKLQNPNVEVSRPTHRPSQWQSLNYYQLDDIQIPDLSATAIPDVFSSLSISRFPTPYAPYTFSFQEKTFARRLHRACLERAFRLLADPNTRPEELSKAFRFTFSFSNKKRMLARFQTLLKSNANDSLENMSTPFFNVGGAGTHFPHRDENGNPIYPSNLQPPSNAFGSSALVLTETPQEEVAITKLLEAIGFSGEWFDSHDVEEYLRARGVKLEGNSTFVDVDPALRDLMRNRRNHRRSISQVADGRSSFDISSSNSTTMSPPSPSQPANFAITPRVVNMDHAGANAPDTISDFSAQMSSSLSPSASAAAFTRNNVDYFTLEPPKPTGYTNFSVQQGHHHQQPFGVPEEPHRARTLTLDVDVLLRAIVQEAVCLGRGPGFSRVDVDTALTRALQAAF